MPLTPEWNPGCYVRYRTETGDSLVKIPKMTTLATLSRLAAHLHARFGLRFAKPRRFAVTEEPLSALRVLVVDDEPLNRMLATAHLLALDINPCLAADGLEAVEMCRAHDFDVVLMDIAMPVMDGISAAAFIRDHQMKDSLRVRSEVVAFTAGILPEEALLSHAGMRHVLRKPCNGDDMGLCISRCRQSLAAAAVPSPPPA